jgi:hypothetical protein
MSRRRSKKFPYHLPNLKGSATAVESQGTNCHNVVRRIQNDMRSGLFIRPEAICRHLGMPTLPVKAATSRTTPNPTKAHQQETSDRPEAI